MVAFTICSNNYIPKSQVLCTSIKKVSATNVFLVLADKKNDAIDYSTLGFDKIIYAEDLPIADLQWMKEHYNIVEFNTALKSFAFEYIFSNTNFNAVYYFDPDIKVYQPIEELDATWTDYKIILTPHCLTAIPFDNKFPGENLFLNHGIFNLGFIGLRRSSVADEVVKWWNERLLKNCIIDLKEGFFVDQIWANVLPVYYPESTFICRLLGANMAYWNLHERKLEIVENQYRINRTEKLFFYHFSSFDINLSVLTPTPEGRYSFEDFPALKMLYQEYKDEYLKFNTVDFKTIKYFDGQYPFKLPTVPLYIRLINKIINYFRR